MAGFRNNVVYADNADFSVKGALNGYAINGLQTNGQMWIGTTTPNVGGTNINVGTLTSPDSSVTIGYSSPNITLAVAGGTTVGKTITGDTGPALSPTSGNWNIISNVASANCGSTVLFSGSGSTLTLNVTDINRNTHVGKSSGSSIPGSDNTCLGTNCLTSATNPSLNVAIGNNSLTNLTSGLANTCLGYSTGNSIVSGFENTYVGATAGNSGTGDQNTSLGSNSLPNATSGSRNIAIGRSAGNAFASTESDNILISNSGVASESHAIRIGNQGSGSFQQNTCYIAGIYGSSVSGSPVLVDSSGQLGNGIMTNTSQPAFLVYLSGNIANVTGDGTEYTIPWDTKTFDQGSNFNTSTNVFTAPVTGLYQFNYTVAVNGLNIAHTLGHAQLVTTQGSYNTGYMNYFLASSSNDQYITSGSWLVPMTAGDVASTTVGVYNGTKTVGVIGALGNLSFSGYLVC